MKVRGVIWDMDGTILDTLEDLWASTCAALSQCGMPERSREEVRAFVGNGLRVLMEKAVPAGTSPQDLEKAMEAFVAHYALHSRDRTCPYPGILKTLLRLKEEGIRQGVVSNKVDFAVQQLSRDFFPGLLEVAVGDAQGRRRKPAPDSVWHAMELLGLSPEETVYIGDSEVDVETARNAGIPSLLVTWGFRTREQLLAAGATRLAEAPEEIPRILRFLETEGSGE